MTKTNQFGNTRPNAERLLQYGFKEQDGSFILRRGIVAGQLILTVKISGDGKTETEVRDSFGEEYRVHLSEKASGSFVGAVRAECEQILGEIGERCFDEEKFRFPQSLEIVGYARKRYGDEPEFLWKGTPGNAVLRRKSSGKWYAALLTVKRSRLAFADKADSCGDEEVEVIDLHGEPKSVSALTDGKRFLPGYHMNKKSWFTVVLDRSVKTEEIYHLLDESYRLAEK